MFSRRTLVLLALLIALVFVSVSGIVDAKKVLLCKQGGSTNKLRLKPGVKASAKKSCAHLKKRDCKAKKHVSFALRAYRKAKSFAARMKNRETRQAAAKVSCAYRAAKQLRSETRHALNQCTKRVKRHNDHVKRHESRRSTQQRLDRLKKPKCELVPNPSTNALTIVCNKKGRKREAATTKLHGPGYLSPFKHAPLPHLEPGKLISFDGVEKTRRSAKKNGSGTKKKKKCTKIVRRALPKGCQFRRLGNHLARVCRKCSVITHKRTKKEQRVCHVHVSRCTRHGRKVRCRKSTTRCRRFKRCVGNKCSNVRSCKRNKKRRMSRVQCNWVRHCKHIRNTKTQSTRKQCARVKRCGPPCRPVRKCRLVRNKKTHALRRQCTTGTHCSTSQTIKKRQPGCRVIRKCKRHGGGARQCRTVTRCKNLKCRRVRTHTCAKNSFAAAAGAAKCKTRRVCRKPLGTCKAGSFRKCRVIGKRGSSTVRTVCKTVTRKCRPISRRYKEKKRIAVCKKQRMAAIRKTCSPRKAVVARKCVAQKSCKVIKNKKSGTTRTVCTHGKSVCGKAARFHHCRAQNKCQVRKNKKTGALRTVCHLVKRNTCPHHCRFVQKCQLRVNKKTNQSRSVCTRHRVCSEGHPPRCKQMKRCKILRNKKTGKWSTKCVLQRKMCVKKRCRRVKLCYHSSKKTHGRRQRMICKKKKLCLPRRRCSAGKKNVGKKPATTVTTTQQCVTVKRCSQQGANSSNNNNRIHCALYTKCPTTCTPTKDCKFEKRSGKMIVSCVNGATPSCHYSYTAITASPVPTPAPQVPQ